MKLSTLNSKLQLLAVGTNAKTIKSDTNNELTAIMYLASSTLSGYDTCPNASEGCKKVCLISAGHGKLTSVQQARNRKTRLYFEKPEEFKKILFDDLTLFKSYCNEHGLNGNVRLNGTSDLDFISFKIKDNKNIFQLFTDINFYDYTKDFDRTSTEKNYYILYSRSENTSELEVKKLIDQNKNVAVVFDEIPDTWNNFEVINGDLSDLRTKDKSGVIVGLKAKGLAKKSELDNGFVIRLKNI